MRNSNPNNNTNSDDRTGSPRNHNPENTATTPPMPYGSNSSEASAAANQYRQMRQELGANNINNENNDNIKQNLPNGHIFSSMPVQAYSSAPNQSQTSRSRRSIPQNLNLDLSNAVNGTGDNDSNSLSNINSQFERVARHSLRPVITAVVDEFDNLKDPDRDTPLQRIRRAETARLIEKVIDDVEVNEFQNGSNNTNTGSQCHGNITVTGNLTMNSTAANRHSITTESIPTMNRSSAGSVTQTQTATPGQRRPAPFALFSDGHINSSLSLSKSMLKPMVDSAIEENCMLTPMRRMQKNLAMNLVEKVVNDKETHDFQLQKEIDQENYEKQVQRNLNGGRLSRNDNIIMYQNQNQTKMNQQNLIRGQFEDGRLVNQNKNSNSNSSSQGRMTVQLPIGAGFNFSSRRRNSQIEMDKLRKTMMKPIIDNVIEEDCILSPVRRVQKQLTQTLIENIIEDCEFYDSLDQHISNLVGQGQGSDVTNGNTNGRKSRQSVSELEKTNRRMIKPLVDSAIEENCMMTPIRRFQRAMTADLVSNVIDDIESDTRKGDNLNLDGIKSINQRMYKQMTKPIIDNTIKEDCKLTPTRRVQKAMTVEVLEGIGIDTKDQEDSDFDTKLNDTVSQTQRVLRVMAKPLVDNVIEENCMLSPMKRYRKNLVSELIKGVVNEDDGGGLDANYMTGNSNLQFAKTIQNDKKSVNSQSPIIRTYRKMLKPIIDSTIEQYEIESEQQLQQSQSSQSQNTNNSLFSPTRRVQKFLTMKMMEQVVKEIDDEEKETNQDNRLNKSKKDSDIKNEFEKLNRRMLKPLIANVIQETEENPEIDYNWDKRRTSVINKLLKGPEPLNSVGSTLTSGNYGNSDINSESKTVTTSVQISPSNINNINNKNLPNSDPPLSPTQALHRALGKRLISNILNDEDMVRKQGYEKVEDESEESKKFLEEIQMSQSIGNLNFRQAFAVRSELPPEEAVSNDKDVVTAVATKCQSHTSGGASKTSTNTVTNTNFKDSNSNLLNPLEKVLASNERLSVLIGVTGSVATVKLPELIEKLLAVKKDSQSEVPNSNIDSDTKDQNLLVSNIDIVFTESASHFLKNCEYKEESISQKMDKLFGISNCIQKSEKGSEAVSVCLNSGNDNKSRQTLNLFSDASEWKSYKNVMTDQVLHIELVKRNDIILIAPLSANSLAKIANGISDNLLSCIVRAFPNNMQTSPQKHLIFAPSMNTQMYENPITNEHIEQIIIKKIFKQKEKFQFVTFINDPIVKLLACGDYGAGAISMAEVGTIVEVVKEKGMEILKKKNIAFTTAANQQDLATSKSLTTTATINLRDAPVTNTSPNIDIMSSQDTNSIREDYYSNQMIVLSNSTAGPFNGPTRPGKKQKLPQFNDITKAPNLFYESSREIIDLTTPKSQSTKTMGTNSTQTSVTYSVTHLNLMSNPMSMSEASNNTSLKSYAGTINNNSLSLQSTPKLNSQGRVYQPEDYSAAKDYDSMKRMPGLLGLSLKQAELVYGKNDNENIEEDEIQTSKLDSSEFQSTSDPLIEDFYKNSTPPSDLQEVSEKVKNLVKENLLKQDDNLVNNLNRRVILVTSGGTSVPLEKQTVRSIENFSSGGRGSISVEKFLNYTGTENGESDDSTSCDVIFLYSSKSTVLPFQRDMRNLLGGDAQSLEMMYNEPKTWEAKVNDAIKRDSENNNIKVNQKIQNKRKFLAISYTTIFDYLFYLKEIISNLKPLKQRAMVYLAAAVSDFYLPQSMIYENKIQSRGADGGQNLTLTLENVPKVLGEIRRLWAPECFLVTFKLETDEKNNFLKKKAVSALRMYGGDCVIANLLQTYKEKVRVITVGGENQNQNKISEVVLTKDEGIKDSLEGKIVKHLLMLQKEKIR